MSHLLFLVTDYINKLLEKLDSYVTSNTVPENKDCRVVTLASQGPKHTNLDELLASIENRRHGLVLKPHYITEQERLLAEQRTAKAKRASEKKKAK